MFRLEHNVETGEIKQIDLTAGEIKEIEKLQKENEPALAKEKAEAESKATAKADLLAKLGITAEEAKLLLS
jgi:hypothetical protein